mmetsp:Transcript_13676/g.33107  ORF Transcript_13676/g.33107 Transcript_13676/m.33107 type:complete len:136 (-) Transcript_13676:331-738(-)
MHVILLPVLPRVSRQTDMLINFSNFFPRTRPPTIWLPTFSNSRKRHRSDANSRYCIFTDFGELPLPNPSVIALIHNVVFMMCVLTQTTHSSRIMYNFLAKNALDAMAKEEISRLKALANNAVDDDPYEDRINIYE